MTNDRELARQAIVELMAIRHELYTHIQLDLKLRGLLVRLIDWLHENCTD